MYEINFQFFQLKKTLRLPFETFKTNIDGNSRNAQKNYISTLNFLDLDNVKVINAATQCALNTSQLVACAKVVAPTIADPLCQDQLMEAARDVAKSVEGCVSECRDVCR